MRHGSHIKFFSCSMNRISQKILKHSHIDLDDYLLTVEDDARCRLRATHAAHRIDGDGSQTLMQIAHLFL